MLVTYITSHKGTIEDLFLTLRSVYLDLLYSPSITYEHLVYLDGECPGDFSILKTLPYLTILTNKVCRGKSACVNDLILRARGKYLFFIDSDDYNLIGRTSRQVNYLESRCCDNLVLGSTPIFFLSPRTLSSPKYPLDDTSIKRNFIFYPFLLYSSLSVNRNFLLENNLLFDSSLRAGLDYEFYSRLFTQAIVENHPQPLIIYSINESGITCSSSTREIQLSVHQKVLVNLLDSPEPMLKSLPDLVFKAATSSLTTEDIILFKSLASPLSSSYQDDIFPNFNFLSISNRDLIQTLLTFIASL